MVFGVNPLAQALLEILEIDYRDVPRFRDCFLSKENTIIVYTRTGGGNREEYQSQNDAMKLHKRYLRDEDDSLDCTYAIFHFSIPDEIKGDCIELIEKGYGIDPSERWKQFIENLQNQSPRKNHVKE
jgi:hypothetical protein